VQPQAIVEMVNEAVSQNPKLAEMKLSAERLGSEIKSKIKSNKNVQKAQKLIQKVRKLRKRSNVQISED
jgi:hypothetical protein